MQDIKGIEFTEIEKNLIAAIRKTLNANLHLADGDNCTLIDLKLVLKELGIYLYE